MSMNTKRRLFLRGSAAVGAVMGAGMLVPSQVLAASLQESFRMQDAGEAMTALLGSSEAEESDKVSITAPEIAENGAVVPITVSSELEGVDSISIFVTENPTPLVASFTLGEGALATAATRIKMGQTSDVVGVVRANGKLYKASREVKVTVGGCGG